jgi:hypothetical protein
MSTLTESAPAENAVAADAGGFIDSIDSFFDVAEQPSAPEKEPESEVASEPQGSVEESPQATEQAAQAEAGSSEPDPLADIDSIDEPKDWTPQAARRFKELKAELKTYRTRAEELSQAVTQRETRLQELEALANNPEYKELQERIDYYEKQMLVTQLENSNAYQTLVQQPLNALVEEVDTIAAKYSVDATSLLDAIANDDDAAQEEQLGELLATATDRDKFRIYKIIEQVTPILEQRNVLQQYAQDALREAEELDNQMHQQTLIERAQQRQEAANAVADKLKNKLTFLSGMEGVDMNALAQEAANVDPFTLDPITGTYQAMAAKLLPKMASQYVQLQKEIESLTERLAEYDRATPKAGGGSLATAGTPSAPDGKSFLDAVTAAFG